MLLLLWLVLVVVQDAMTAAYPKIEDDGPNTYRRTHMELFI